MGLKKWQGGKSFFLPQKPVLKRTRLYESINKSSLFTHRLTLQNIKSKAIREAFILKHNSACEGGGCLMIS